MTKISTGQAVDTAYSFRSNVASTRNTASAGSLSLKSEIPTVRSRVSLVSSHPMERHELRNVNPRHNSAAPESSLNLMWYQEQQISRHQYEGTFDVNDGYSNSSGNFIEQSTARQGILDHSSSVMNNSQLDRNGAHLESMGTIISSETPSRPKRTRKTVLTAQELQQLVKSKPDETFYVPTIYEKQQQRGQFSCRDKHTERDGMSGRVFYLSNVQKHCAERNPSEIDRSALPLEIPVGQYRDHFHSQVMGRSSWRNSDNDSYQRISNHVSNSSVVDQAPIYQRIEPTSNPSRRRSSSLMIQKNNTTRPHGREQHSEPQPPNQTDRNEETAPIDETEKSDRSPRRKVNYKPYTMDDYKNMNRPVVLGSLGPDLMNEELQKKQQKLERVRQYARGVSEYNAQKIAHEMSASSASSHTRKTDLQPKEISARQRAREFAKNIPKPRTKPRGSDEVENSYRMSGGYIEGEPAPMTELERLEILHRQNQEWIRNEFNIEY